MRSLRAESMFVLIIGLIYFLVNACMDKAIIIKDLYQRKLSTSSVVGHACKKKHHIPSVFAAER